MSSNSPPEFRAHPRGSRDSPAATLRRAWQQGQEPALDAFVAGLTDVSPTDLAALIRVDFEARWHRNDPRPPEEYLQAYAAVADDAESAVDVIYAEYLAREKSGQQPGLAEYEQRFPEYADILAEQIRLHLALESIDDGTMADGSGDVDSDNRSLDASSEASNLDASYEILGQIGAGGMGVVYKARQPGLNRFVALKMVRAIDAGNPELLARFRSEARVVAALHNQNIVQVYDYGQHEDLPYIAMELIPGGSLADRLNGTPWQPRAAAALLIQLAGAVQFAHERNVIHRDLKPANVLVVSDDNELEVKITDFGLAKFHADHSSPHTKSIAFLGTPSYMAPEQARGRARDTGPATDIYSLGAILYELLTGQPPFRGESPIETLRLLLSSEPASIYRIAPHTSRDLATICHKCLQIDPRNRYASAAELRADLQRYLDGIPINARPIGSIERTWRWCQRNPYLAAALGLVAMLLVGIAAVSTWYSAQLRRELTRTRLVEQAEHEANQAAQQQLWNAYMSEAAARNSSHQVGQRFAALESVEKARSLLDTVGRDRDRELQLRNAVLASMALPDMRQVRSISNFPQQGHAAEMSVSADRYVVATLDGTLAGFRLSDSQALWSIDSVDSQATPVLSRDGRFVAAVGPQGAKVWRVDQSKPQFAWEAPGKQFFLDFTPDGEHAFCSDLSQGMRLVRSSDGVAVRAVGKGVARSNFAYHASTNRVAVCAADGVQVIAVESGKIDVQLRVEPSEEWLLAWHPSGDFLAVWGDQGGIGLWNVTTGVKAVTFPHGGARSQLGFNGDGSILVSQSLWNHRFCAWDVGSGQRFIEVPEFVSRACDVGPDQGMLFITVQGADVVLTELSDGACRALPQTLYPPLEFWHKVSISPEGRIAAFSSTRGLELWDIQANRRLVVSPIGWCQAEFDRAGRLTVGCPKGIYRLSRHNERPPRSGALAESDTNPPPKRTVVHFGDAERLTEPIVPASFATNDSGETLIFEDQLGWAVKRLDHGAEVVRLQMKGAGDPRCGAVSNDGRYVAIANWENPGAAVWDVQSGKRLAELAIGPYGFTQFSPDGHTLTTSPDGVALWSTGDWRPIAQLDARGTTPTGLGLAFSPDSRVLAVGQVNGVLSLFDSRTGHEWAGLSRSDLSVATSLAFSRDQRWLVTTSIDDRSPAQVWDLAAMRRELSQRGLDFPNDILRPLAGPPAFEAELEARVELP